MTQSSHLHLMIDIETLATHHSAPILQIGAVKFSPLGIVDIFDSYIAPQFTPPHIPDPSTIAWWFAQLKANPDLTPPLNLDAPSFRGAFALFLGWLGASTIDGVWANDPSFDLAILTSHARTHDLTIPFTHRQERSFRTLKSIVPPNVYHEIKTTYAPVIPHDARSDARAQALQVIAMHNYLTSLGVNVL